MNESSSLEMFESLTFKQIERNYRERVPDIDDKEFWLVG